LDLRIGIVASIILAGSGIYIAIHEARRRERKVTRKEIKELTEEVDQLVTETHDLRVLLLQQRRYIYKLVTLMIDHGMNPPQPPEPSFDPGEYDTDEPDEL